MKHKRSIPKDRFRVGRRLAEKTIRKFARGQKYFPFMSQVDGGEQMKPKSIRELSSAQRFALAQGRLRNKPLD